MKSTKRNLGSDVVAVCAGLILWHVTLNLLGAKPLALRGAAEHFGSIIVLVGCLSLVRGLSHFLSLIFYPKKTEEKIYDEVMTEIASETKAESTPPLERSGSTGPISNFASQARRD